MTSSIKATHVVTWTFVFCLAFGACSEAPEEVGLTQQAANACGLILLGCSDGNPCTLDTCNVLSGTCSHTPLLGCCTQASDCDDGLLCSLDTCNVLGLVCVHLPVVSCCEAARDCDDNDPCTVDSCGSGNNRCVHQAIAECCTTDGSCDDGLACTQDVCDLGTNTCLNPEITGCCTTENDCDDGSACTTDSCNSTTSTCESTPINGCCAIDNDCGDANPCTVDTCNTNSGECERALIPGCCASHGDCADTDTCTTDRCDTTTHACTHNNVAGCCNDDGDCDDANAATADVCDVAHAICQNTLISGRCNQTSDCAGNSPCTSVSCNTQTSTCETEPIATCCSTAQDCEDGNACTAHECATGSCTTEAIDGCCNTAGDCFDGNPATPDTCNVTTHRCDNETPSCGSLQSCDDAGAEDGGLEDGGGPLDGGTGGTAGASGSSGGNGGDAANGGNGGDAANGGNGGDAANGGNGGNGGDAANGGNGGDAANGGNGGHAANGGNGGGAANGGNGGDAANGGNGGNAADGGNGGDAANGGNGGDAANGGAGNAGDSGGAANGADDDGRPKLMGGACSVSNHDGSLGWLWFACMLIVVRAHRRARVPALFFLALCTLGWSVPASAQAIRLDRYTAPVRPDDLLWIERASVQSNGPFGRIAITYADDPLVARQSSGSSDQAVLVDHQVGIHLAAGMTLLDRLHLAIAVPIFAQGTEGDWQTAVGTTDIKSVGLGDPALDLRVVALGPDAPLELAFAATLRVPLGNARALASDDQVSVIPRVIVSRALPWHRSFITASAGAVVSGNERFGALRMGPQLVGGLGALVSITQSVGVTAEFAGSTVIDQAFKRQYTPVEGTLGGRFQPDASGLVAGVGIGTGFTAGVGSPDFRLLATVAYAPLNEQQPVIEDAPIAPRDTDQDGIVDSLDRCPSQPEDFDGFQDEDGCPENDNDGDGIADGSDQCPLEAEDIDGFQDEDGCPENDNDGDGIADGSDQCPLEAETENGIDDEDGCPDFVRVETNAGRIRILTPIHFATASDRILPDSFPLLVEMANVLVTRSELGRVSVEGHTDSRGSDKSNLRLSQQRAASVERFLIEHGLEPSRIESHGFGESQPVESNDTAEGRAANRRVAFRLTDIPVVEATNP